MTASAVGMRYATALLNLADERGEVDQVGKQLEDVVAAWRASRELQQIFENPAYGPDVRRNIIADLADAAKVSDIVRNALMLLSDRQRFTSLSDVADAYRTLAERRAGHVRAEIITAVELPEAYFGELKQVLEAATGKQVVIARRVDSSLIGGVVTKVGDRVFDGSVKHRLEELKETLLLQT
jgi:F-type H+-transporting ATPase subunit delta